MPSVWADFARLTKEMQNFGGQRFLHIILPTYMLLSKLMILMACSVNNFMPLDISHSAALGLALSQLRWLFLLASVL